MGSLPVAHSKEHGLAIETQLIRRIQVLTGQFVQMEQRFLLQSVQKAWTDTDSLDIDDTEQLTTTLVDDAFFILMQSCNRAMGTLDVTAVCAVVNWVGDAIQNQLKDALAKNLAESKGSYSNFVGYAENIAPPAPGEHALGKLFEIIKAAKPPGSDLTAAVSWPHSLNNLQLCAEYIERLKEQMQTSFDAQFPVDGPDGDKRVMFEQCVAALDSAKSDLEAFHISKCKEGVMFFKSHLSRELRPLSELDYDINEMQYEDFKVNDPWARAFVAQAEVVHHHLKAVLVPASCDECMSQLAEMTCKGIESRVTDNKHFSLYGALFLESEIRLVRSFYMRSTEQAIMHKFAKLLDMTALLTLENSDEFRETMAEQRTWRLSNEDMRKLLVARTDFDAGEAELEMMLPS